MERLNFFSKKQNSNQNRKSKKISSPPQVETFILEPILTPSGIVDSGDQNHHDLLVTDSHLSDLPEVHTDAPNHLTTHLTSEIDRHSDSTIDTNHVTTSHSDLTNIEFISDRDSQDIANHTINTPISEHDLEPISFIPTTANSDVISHTDTTSVTIDSKSLVEASHLNSDLSNQIDRNTLTNNTTDLTHVVTSHTQSELTTNITTDSLHPLDSATHQIDNSHESPNSVDSNHLITQNVDSEHHSTTTDDSVHPIDSTTDKSDNSNDTLILIKDKEAINSTEPTDAVNHQVDSEHHATVANDSVHTDTSGNSTNSLVSKDIGFIGNPTLDKISSLGAEKVDFTSGVFTVGETGKVSVDYLFDGGGYKGELAIFSIHGMEKFEPGSSDFIQEAAHRALSNSELGYVVISDPTEGAKFNSSDNFGNYLGAKEFNMRPGDEFGVMLVPNGTLQQVFNNPNAGGALRPLFSLVTANPNQGFHVGQIADVTGDGHTFALEDLRVDSNTDRDYNDLIFHVRGATGKAVNLDEVIASGNDWRTSKIGQELIAFAKSDITSDLSHNGNANVGLPEVINHSDNSVNAPASDVSHLDTDTSSDNANVGDNSSDNSTIPDRNPSDVTSSFNRDIVGENPSAIPTISEPIHSDVTQDIAVGNQSAIASDLSLNHTDAHSSYHPDIVVGDKSAIGSNSDVTHSDVNSNSYPGIAVGDKSAIVSNLEPNHGDMNSNSYPGIAVGDKSAIATVPDVTHSDVNSNSHPDISVNAKNETSPISEPIHGDLTKDIAAGDKTPIPINKPIPHSDISTSNKTDDTSPIQTLEPSNTAVTSNSIQTDTTSTTAVEHSEVIATSPTQNVTPNSDISTAGYSQEISVTETTTTSSTVSQTPAVTVNQPSLSTFTPDIKVTDSEHNTPVIDALPPIEPSIIKPEIPGSFTVDSTGRVSVDYLFDGGAYQGDLAIFSLKGMEHLQPGSEAFIQEAAHRALSSSELGHIVISDALEGARFSGKLGEQSWNDGAYQGAKTVSMTPGDEFAIMLVPNGKVQEVFDNPKIGGAKSPLFSISTVQGNLPQMVDVTGKGHTFAFEDLRIDKADRDYNDIIFQVNGANTKAVDMDDVIDPAKDWRNLELGKTILEYADLSANQATFDNVIDQVNTDLVPQVDDVLQQLNTQLQEIIAKPDSISLESDPTTEQQADAEIAQLESELDKAIAELTNDPLGDIDGLAGKYNFAKEAQPLLGIIDTGFVDNNPDIDYGRIILGSDRIDNDNNPLLSATEADAEHGTKILELIAAKQNNNIGLDGVNDDAPLWLGRAVGSGNWADSLVEFVDAAKASKQPNAVVNLSFDLTETKPDGTVITRTEFTAEERAAIEYAHQNNVLIVAAAGNQGEANISALGKASKEFDNIITVGAFDGLNRADYSNYGTGLDLLAYGSTPEQIQAATATQEQDFLNNLTTEQQQALQKALDVNQQLPYDTQANIPELSVQDEQTALAAIQKAMEAALGEMGNIGNIDTSSIQPTDEIAGTSIAAAKVTGAASQVWAANPDLSFAQVKEILKQTAWDLGTPGWDAETGAGLLNLAAAVQLASETKPKPYTDGSILSTSLDTWIDDGLTTPDERAAGFWKKIKSIFSKVTNVFKKVVNAVTKVVGVIKKVIDIGKKVWGFFSKAKSIFSKVKSFFTNIVCKFISLPVFGKIGVIFGGLALVAGAIGGLVWWFKQRKQQQQQPPQPQPDPIPQDIQELRTIWNNVLTSPQKNALRSALLNGIPSLYQPLFDGTDPDGILNLLSTINGLTPTQQQQLGGHLLDGVVGSWKSFFDGTNPANPFISQAVKDAWNSLTLPQQQILKPFILNGVQSTYGRPLFNGDPNGILSILPAYWSGNLNNQQQSLIASLMFTLGGVPDQYHSFFP